MTYIVYENIDEATQIFVGVLLILLMVFVMGANIYFWINDKKNKK